MPTPANLEPLFQMIQQVDDKQDEAHSRLRQTMIDVAQRVESNYEFFRTGMEANKAKIALLEQSAVALTNAPVNIDKIIFTPRVVATIVVSLLTLYGFFLASTAGIKASVNDVSIKMDEVRRHGVDYETLENERFTRLSKDIADIKGQQTMQELRITNLRETVLSGQKVK